MKNIVCLYLMRINHPSSFHKSIIEMKVFNQYFSTENDGDGRFVI